MTAAAGSPAPAQSEPALAQLRAGGLILLVDEERDCGDFVASGATITEQDVNLMVREGRGIVAVAITVAQRDRLQLKPMPGTSHLATVEAAEGVSTGISAGDRARTIRVLSDPRSEPEDLVSPGHVVPIVGTRRESSSLGAAEAALAVAERAGATAAVACAVLDDDGRQAIAARVRELAARLELPCATSAALLGSGER